MGKQILFLHGGGGKEDYDADAMLVESLQSVLGNGYSIRYPFLDNNGTPDLGRREQIRKQISLSKDGVILVAHSLGASMLLACLTEMVMPKKVVAAFLISTPFWTGDEDWVEAFKLQPQFQERLDKNTPLYFYHCLDDEEVPLAQFETYKQKIPWATFREIQSGGHQLNNDLTPVANDIKSL